MNCVKRRCMTFVPSFPCIVDSRNCTSKRKAHSNLRVRQGKCWRSRLWVCSGNGVGSNATAVTNEEGKGRLHVVFVHPQIHWNTGNIGRTCLGLGATLHLIEPIGFSLDDAAVRRAGLDYWQHVQVHVYKSWEEFVRGKMVELGGTRYFFTKFGTEGAMEIEWPEEGNVLLIFGSEVDGFDGIRDWLEGEGKGERCVAFPMVNEKFRCYNLSTTAAMALWDAYKSLKLRESRLPKLAETLHTQEAL